MTVSAGVDETVTVHPSPSRELRPQTVLGRGATIGRYLVVESIASGGMGSVYQCYDPELDRGVAIKLLRSLGRDGAGSARMLREARTLARLSHPNVVPIFDVGEIESTIYLAMELIEGEPLSDWVERERPDVPAIVDAYMQAGRGLAAAHALGIVHHDFKPGNAVRGADGRVRVVDFGLARSGDKPESRPLEIATPDHKETSRSVSAGTHLTELGMVLGTPAYMAPEQRRGERTDGRTDQFSFCMSIWQALYGERPFPDDSPEDRNRAIRSGPTPKPGRDVPKYLERAITKGLAYGPENRFEDMHALVAAMDPAPRRRLRRGVVAASVLGVVGVVAGLAISPEARPDCDADLGATWDTERRFNLEATFDSWDAPYAASAKTAAIETIDAYADSWRKEWNDACVATEHTGTQSVAVMDLRTSCLESRRAQLDEALTLVGEGDPATLERALRILSTPASPAGCSDVARLRTMVPPPSSAEQREAVNDVERDLYRAKLRAFAVSPQDSAKILQDVLERARATEYAPLKAAALRELSVAHSHAGDAETAIETLHGAILEAERGGDELGRAKAWAQLGWVMGYEHNRPDEGLRYLDLAETIGEKLERSTELLATVAGSRAAIYLHVERDEEGLEAFQRALDLTESNLGANHPQTISHRLNLGQAQNAVGQHETAMATIAMAVAAYRDLYGDVHPEVIRGISTIGVVLGRMGRHRESLEKHERALVLAQRLYGDDPRELADHRSNIAFELNALGRAEEALPHFEAVRATWAEQFGPDSPDAAIGENNLGDALRLTGRCDEALANYERANEIRAKALPPDHSHTAYSLTGAGICLVELDRAPEAILMLERALEIREAKEHSVARVAETRFALARALWESGQTTPRARELARKAATIPLEGNEAFLAQVQAWLAERPVVDATGG